MKNWGSILKMLIIRREERSVLVEFAAEEKAAGEHYQQQGAGDLRECRGPEGGGVGDELGEHAAQEDAYAHAEIPRGEYRRIGRAALVVPRHGDKHVEECGIHAAVAQSNQECRQIERPLPRSKGKQRESDRTEQCALHGVFGQQPAAQLAGAVEARDHEAAREDGEEDAGAVGDAHLFFGVDGHIVRHHAPAEAEKEDVECHEPCAGEEKVVETHWRFPLHRPAARQLYGGGASEACQSHRERDPEQEREIAGSLIDPYACRGGDGHGQVVAQAVEAHPLVAARGGERVDSGCRVGNGGGAEGEAVERAHDGKHQQRACADIPRKTYEKEEKAAHKHLLAVETVDDKTAEWAHYQRRYHIARQHQADHVLRGAELLVEIYRQQGCQQIEGEEHHEIAGHGHAIVAVPQPLKLFLFLFVRVHSDNHHTSMMACTSDGDTPSAIVRSGVSQAEVSSALSSSVLWAVRM